MIKGNTKSEEIIEIFTQHKWIRYKERQWINGVIIIFYFLDNTASYLLSDFEHKRWRNFLNAI